MNVVVTASVRGSGKGLGLGLQAGLSRGVLLSWQLPHSPAQLESCVTPELGGQSLTVRRKSTL